MSVTTYTKPGLEQVLGAMMVMPKGNPMTNGLKLIEDYTQPRSNASDKVMVWAIKWGFNDQFRDGGGYRVAYFDASDGRYLGEAN